jgi:hypothetical protein
MARIDAPHCSGPTVPASFNRTDLTQPDTLSPVRALMNMTDDHPSSVCA